jgi:hypothetical protein
MGVPGLVGFSLLQENPICQIAVEQVRANR